MPTTVEITGGFKPTLDVAGSAAAVLLFGGSPPPPLGSLFYEIPGGAIDGVNNTFTVSHVPRPNSLLLFCNGLQQAPAGNDYTLSGFTITMTPGAIPRTGDSLWAYYWV